MSADESAGIVVGQARSVTQLAAAINPGVQPTPQQAAIIEAGVGPMLVVAGAGSGKTETLSTRMVYLLDHAQQIWGEHISPEQILCLTFTRKAATEIEERTQRHLVAAFGRDPLRPVPSVSTYDGYAAALVAEHGLRIGVDPDATHITDAALWQIAQSLVEEWTDPLETPSAVSSVVSAIPSLSAQLRDHQRTPAQLRAWTQEALAFVEGLPKKAADAVPGKLTQALEGDIGKLRTLIALSGLVEQFQARKRAASVVDFADRSAMAVELAKLDSVQAIERSRYRVVLLDEFQDTSPAQLELFSTVFGTEHPVMAVGDPNQAIYGFRGASAAALDRFAEYFGDAAKGGGAAQVQQRSLSVSWRNEANILHAANAIAEPLRASSKVHVDALTSTGEYLGRPEPARERQSVTAEMYADLEAEAGAVVEFVTERREELARQQGKQPQEIDAAVLCRRRAQFGPIAEACARAGLPFEVVGLGGLLDTPEVADIVALLHVTHDPSRGDSLMRLLTSERLALGPRDLMALADWSQELAGPRETRDVEPSIVDAIAALPPTGWASRDGRELSAIARARIEELQGVIALLRRHTYIAVPELIVFVERAWGLDIETAVAHPDGRGTRNIDAFVSQARAFAHAAERATLGAFLAWLDAAREEEGGLAAPVKAPEPGSVQILTVHGSKGLEWDVVAVPGMTDTHFPSVTPPSKDKPTYRSSGWLDGKRVGQLPWPLRMDSANLPEWFWRDAVDHKTLGQTIADFKNDAGQHALDEERRLFYVAVTRARSYVQLSGSWLGSGATVLKPSCFVEELVDLGIVSKDGWAERPDPDGDPVVRAVPSVPWPGAPSEAQTERRAFAADVREAMAALTVGGSGAEWDESLPLAREIAAMMEARAEARARQSLVTLPTHLSTSSLVALKRDRAAFTEQLRRPVPVEPSLAAVRGNAFHAWVEQHYSVATLLPDDFAPASGLEESALEALQDSFLASPWAGRNPSHVEVDVEVPIAGTIVRSRIDAVFPAAGGTARAHEPGPLARLTVVDWKSGRPPRDEAERAARDVQLSAYRLAWSEWKGVPLAEVDAAFFFAATGETVAPSALLDREAIEALIRGE